MNNFYWMSNQEEQDNKKELKFEDEQKQLEKKLAKLAKVEKANGPHKFWDNQPVLKISIFKKSKQ